jgi:DNA polymerase I-like protein with 3'-5' exonuclease and polymerase domains
LLTLKYNDNNDFLQRYADRWEVKAWQEETIRRAHLTGYTKTLMGRLRRLPGINRYVAAAVFVGEQQELM